MTVNSHSVMDIVLTFSVNSSHFKKFKCYEILTGVDYEKLEGITPQIAQGHIADFRARLMQDHQNQTLAPLKPKYNLGLGR